MSSLLGLSGLTSSALKTPQGGDSGKKILPHSAKVAVPLAGTQGVVAHGILHPPNPAAPCVGGVVLVAGAGGGVLGPSHMYPALASRLASAGVAAIRMDYRHPNHTPECVQDVKGGLDTLKAQCGVNKAVVIGWSFGGAVVFQAAAQFPEVVAGVATVASQTADVGPRPVGAGKPVLLLHGSGDTCLSDRCSRTLYTWAQETKELVIYEGDDHGLSRNAQAAEAKLANFVLRTLGAGGGNL